MKTTAIYIRVSTDAQREEGYSIEAQREALCAYCLSKGWKTYELYIDGGFSGSNLERPAMQRLITDVEQGRIARVLVYKLDRLSRSQKDTLHLIEDVLNPHGVDFISLNESMDTGTPMGRLMLGILSAFAQLERENIRERTRMGMKERVKAGYWMGGGRIPFGYDYDEEQGILVPNADAETVRRMYRLYLDGYSPAEIAAVTGFAYDRQVTQILKRRTNLGLIPFRGEEYRGRHQPLVSRETYDQAMLEMEARASKNLRSESYLLTGLVRCGYCGAKLRYQKWGKKGHKLVCYSRYGSKPYLVRDPDCPQEPVWADEVEEAVIRDLFRFPARQSLGEGENEESMETLLTEEERRASRRLQRLYRLYAEAEDEALMSEIRAQREDCARISEKLRLERERRLYSHSQKRLYQAIANLEEVWPRMTPQERQRLVHQTVESITLKDNELTVHYKIGVRPVRDGTAISE